MFIRSTCCSCCSVATPQSVAAHSLLPVDKRFSLNQSCHQLRRLRSAARGIMPSPRDPRADWCLRTGNRGGLFPMMYSSAIRVRCIASISAHAPALAGVIWYFLMNPSVGIVAYWLQAVGYDWNHYVNGDQALLMVMIKKMVMAMLMMLIMMAMLMVIIMMM